MTKPIPGILTREITEEKNDKFSAITSELLKEIANFGTQVFHIYTEVTKEKYKPYENRISIMKHFFPYSYHISSIKIKKDDYLKIFSMATHIKRITKNSFR